MNAETALPEKIGDFQCSLDTWTELHRMACEKAQDRLALPFDFPDELPPVEHTLMHYDLPDPYRAALAAYRERDAACFPAELPWRLYRMTGDSSDISENWESMCRHVSCIVSRTDSLSMCRLLSRMADCAQILRKKTQEEEFLRMREAYRHSAEADGWDSLAALCLAAEEQLLPESEIRHALTQSAESLSTVEITPEILRVCSENGYADAIAHRLIPESSGNADNSLLWKTDLWLYHYLGGLRPLSAGFSGIWIEPCFLPNVQWVKVRRRGISVEWDDRAIRITTPVPGVLCMNGKTWRIFPGKHIFPRV